MSKIAISADFVEDGYDELVALEPTNQTRKYVLEGVAFLMFYSRGLEKHCAVCELGYYHNGSSDEGYLGEGHWYNDSRLYLALCSIVPDNYDFEMNSMVDITSDIDGPKVRMLERVVELANEE